MQNTQAPTLDALFAAVQSLDPGGEYRDRSYNHTLHNTIDPSRWWVNIPFGDWDDHEEPPSPLQRSLLAALSEAPGGAGTGTPAAPETVLIDIAHLGFSSYEFFTQNEPSVARKLADYVNALPRDGSVRPVIRYLVGRPDGDRPMADGLMRALFPREDGKYTALIDHPHAEIYCGSFTPSLSFTTRLAAGPELAAAGGPWHWLVREAGRVEHRAAELVQVVGRLETAVETFWSGLLDAAARRHPAIHGELVAQAPHMLAALKDFAGFLATSVSWNHAKVFAVRGSTLVTGGANYWGDYGAWKDSPYDLAMFIQGGAAVDAHRFSDYLWGYLGYRPPTDSTSWIQRHLPGDPPGEFTPGGHPPQSGPAPAHAGTVPALSVSKNGMWPVHLFGLPVNVFDALRDFAVNAAAAVAQGRLGLGAEAGALLAHELRDDSDTFWGPLRALGVSPAGWACRFARNHAIAAAGRSVRMSQQKFLMDDLMNDGSNAYTDTVVPRVREAAGCTHGPDAWDGWFWPFDTLLALGYALSRIAGQGSSAGAVEIVCSYYKPGYLEYQDPVAAGAFKARLAAVMRGMQVAGLIDVLPVDAGKLVEDAVVYKRVDLEPNRQANHSKLVMVDDALCYVGSDNAYPAYNQEFGVWIGDGPAVAAFKERFWDGLWKVSEVAPPDR